MAKPASSTKFLIPVYGMMIVCLFLGIYNFVQKPKIAFIRSATVLEKYQGMKEAQHLYHQKLQEWQRNSDTLEARYQKQLATIQSKASEWSEAEKQSHEFSLQQIQAKMVQYQQEVERLSLEENEKLIQGALNQLNSVVEEYARKKDFDLVLGVTLSGNIMYGDDYIDITDEVISHLNKTYIQ